MNRPLQTLTNLTVARSLPAPRHRPGVVGAGPGRADAPRLPALILLALLAAPAAAWNPLAGMRSEPSPAASPVSSPGASARALGLDSPWGHAGPEVPRCNSGVDAPAGARRPATALAAPRPGQGGQGRAEPHRPSGDGR